MNCFRIRHLDIDKELNNPDDPYKGTGNQGRTSGAVYLIR